MITHTHNNARLEIFKDNELYHSVDDIDADGAEKYMQDFMFMYELWN